LVALPINGVPNNKSVGALITPRTSCHRGQRACNGEALAASASEYAAPAPLKARTNWP